MNEVLQMTEIEKQFDSEWVLLAEPETDEQLNVLNGKVLYHHRDRLTFDQEVSKFMHPAESSRVIYVGETEEPIITRLMVGFTF